MRNVKFTVDSALLRELGARLVGKPHIALAELIKNSYDADARNVTILFTGTEIVVEDDGHGMTPERFISFWMRVGTTNKSHQVNSPELGRALTGSKGVGRLAAQLLARRLKIESVGLVDPALKGFEARQSASGDKVAPSVVAMVDWESAIHQGELTAVEVPISEGQEVGQFLGASNIGTRVTLEDLRDEWDEDSFKELAREIWALQPPFKLNSNDKSAFSVELRSRYPDVAENFRKQMEAILKGWQGEISLTLKADEPEAEVLFEFDALGEHDEDESVEEGQSRQDKRAGEESSQLTRLLELDIALGRHSTRRVRQRVRVINCPIQSAEGQVRVFNLQGRQAKGVAVKDAREWMSAFGGVHIYDDGFRLPYYGPEDWLNIERDHARRLSRSQLVPPELRVPKALHDLPSRRRVFGEVRISTARERRSAQRTGLNENQTLSIQVSRDRLADNSAFRALRNVVRLSLDLYATEQTKAKAVAAISSRKSNSHQPRPSQELGRVRDALEPIRDVIPEPQFESIVDYLDEAEKGFVALETSRGIEASLLGSLATVGMTTLAWEHESAKQRLIVRNSARQLARGGSDLEGQAMVLLESANRLDDIAKIFRPVLDREARETMTALHAQKFIRRTADQISVLGRGAVIRTEGVDKALKLPAGTYAGWSAIFQNLFINSFNAVLEQNERLVQVDSLRDGETQVIRIQDTGVGVDPIESERLFLPFQRGANDDPRRAALGLGGSGLGLTIVRMIADTMGVTVRFAKPDSPFSASVLIEWRG